MLAGINPILAGDVSKAGSDQPRPEAAALADPRPTPTPTPA